MYKNEQSGCTLEDKPGGSEQEQEGNSGPLHWSREKWWVLDYGLYLGIGGMRLVDAMGLGKRQKLRIIPVSPQKL